MFGDNMNTAEDCTTCLPMERTSRASVRVRARVRVVRAGSYVMAVSGVMVTEADTVLGRPP